MISIPSSSTRYDAWRWTTTGHWWASQPSPAAAAGQHNAQQQGFHPDRNGREERHQHQRDELRQRHAAEHDPPAEAIDGDGAGIEMVHDAVSDGRRRRHFQWFDGHGFGDGFSRLAYPQITPMARVFELVPARRKFVSRSFRLAVCYRCFPHNSASWPRVAAQATAVTWRLVCAECVLGWGWRACCWPARPRRSPSR